MTPPAKLNEYNHAEEPARRLLERLGWTYAPREALEAERGDQRDVLLKGRLRRALLRLNEWMTEEQAKRVIFELEHIDATGMARNRAVHEYLTYGMPLTVHGSKGRDSRVARFFDFDHPESGLNEFVVTTQFRVRRSAERLAACVDRWWPRLGRGERSRILIRDQRQRWGSCAPDGTLRFNWRAMMLGAALIEYIVVHELAHLTHRNHSTDFWDLVAAALPHSQRSRQLLREAGPTLPL